VQQVEGRGERLLDEKTRYGMEIMTHNNHKKHKRRHTTARKKPGKETRKRRKLRD
jgi:hypothetical protein